MSAKTPNYQKYYREFYYRLKEDPKLKFSSYCEEIGVPLRRLYDWMTWRHISLKRLYAGYEQPVPQKEGARAGGKSGKAVIFNFATRFLH